MSALARVGFDERASAAMASREDWAARIALGAVAALLVVGIGLPLVFMLAKSFQNASGDFVGLANYVRYFSTPTLVRSLFNTIGVGVLTTAIVIPLAFVYAYALTRSRMPMRGLFHAIALLPLFAPSLLSAISLIYIFGNQGFLKALMFGGTIYGPLGIVMAQCLYCFPQALLILVTALSMSDARLYEAADAMGASRGRVFRTVTLPGARYGIVSAAFVVFTLVVTDFGIAKVIGGQFDVLATDAYKQVVGQQNFQMGAVVGFVLLAPAVLAFFADRWVRRRQVALVTARAVPLNPKPRAARDWPLLAFCCAVAMSILGVFAMAVWASLITYWPYNLTLSLNNYQFTNFDASGWAPIANSLQLAAMTAIVGTTVCFIGAYLVEKTKGLDALRGLVQFLAMLPMAVPGLVLGLAYVFFFVSPNNPLNGLYGTLTLLALNSICHFYTVAHITATTALKQIDPEFEAVSASLKVPFYRTFARVTVPVCLPAILDIFVYLFVNALTTVSAVIFLYGAQTKLAAIAIVHMDEAGQTAPAAALATLIVGLALTVKIAQVVLSRTVFTRLQAWRTR